MRQRNHFHKMTTRKRTLALCLALSLLLCAGALSASAENINRFLFYTDVQDAAHSRDGIANVTFTTIIGEAGNNGVAEIYVSCVNGAFEPETYGETVSVSPAGEAERVITYEDGFRVYKLIPDADAAWALASFVALDADGRFLCLAQAEITITDDDMTVEMSYHYPE